MQAVYSKYSESKLVRITCKRERNTIFERIDIMGHTAVEKIFAKHAHIEEAFPGDVVTLDLDLLMFHGPGTPAIFFKGLENMGVNVRRAFNPEKVTISLGHHQCLPASDSDAQAMVVSREFANRFNIKNLYDVGSGNVHILMIEKGHAFPGSLCIGSDSHSTIYGCVGAFGAAASESTESFITGKTWFEVPNTVRASLHGKLMKGVAPRDVAQYLLSDGVIGSDGALNRVLEFSGSFIKSISMYQRMIFSLLAYEMGAVTGFIEADDVTIAFMKDRVRGPYEVVHNDTDCEFEKEWDVDVSTLEPQIACTPRPSNVKLASEVEAENISVQQAYLGGCTGSSVEDFIMAAEVLRGRKLHSDTRLLVIPGTEEIAAGMFKEGLMEFFAELGAIVSPPYCGPCQMLCYGNLGLNEVMIGTHPRNQVGRTGRENGGIYGGSPYSVAAAAIAGKIVDPRKYL